MCCSEIGEPLLFWNTSQHVKSGCCRANKHTFVPTRHKHPSSHTHTHSLVEEQQCEEWSPLAQESGSCENRRLVMSERQRTMGSKATLEVGFTGSSGRLIWSVCARWDANMRSEKERELWEVRRGKFSTLRWTVWPPDRSRVLQVQSYTPAFFPPHFTPSHGEKTQQRAGGARCQMCQVIAADCRSKRSWKEVCECVCVHEHEQVGHR